MIKAADALEREAWRRGVEGIDRSIMYQGQVVASSKEYSNRLLELLLKAHGPAKYKERVPSDSSRCGTRAVSSAAARTCLATR
jgi:hypothetical protein